MTFFSEFGIISRSTFRHPGRNITHRKENIMPRSLSQKTFKMEFEFAVAMDEVAHEHPGTTNPVLDLDYLDQLQQALVKDETALARQMLQAAILKLQEYADYLAAQDGLTPLSKVAAELESNDGALPNPSGDNFLDLTRPIRVNSLSARLQSSAIHEQVAGETGETRWEPVWVDLRPGSEFGRMLDRYAVPAAPAPFLPGLKDSHYLLARYLTRQRDGVHLEARCTCETTIEGVGEDECQALDRLWENYQKHVERTSTARRIQIGLKNYLMKD